MAKDLLLQDMAFGFVRVAPRAVKPRETGLTICADRGLGMNRVADLLETSKEYIDFIKIGKGSYRLQTEEFLKRKIATYKEAATSVFIAGDSRDNSVDSRDAAHGPVPLDYLVGRATEILVTSLPDRAGLWVGAPR